MTNKEKLQDILEQAKTLDGQISEDELKEIVGGGRCVCVIGGGGSAEGKDKTCACVIMGAGDSSDAGTRCQCSLSGNGESKNY